MKVYFWSLIFLFCSLSLFFIGKSADQVDLMAERYKRALDAGANAAASYRAYNSQSVLTNQGTGYGTGLENGKNIVIRKDEVLIWFYRLFFRNMCISDINRQNQIKRYIPMKALICYDRMMIADLDDNWTIYDSSGEKAYLITYRGKTYQFTLSDQIYDLAAGQWIRDRDIGLTEDERRLLVTDYIVGELNRFLNSRSNKESENRYKLNISLGDVPNDKLSPISGVNFIVFCEGLPISALNPFKKERFYAFGLGGGEINRE